MLYSLLATQSVHHVVVSLVFYRFLLLVFWGLVGEQYETSEEEKRGTEDHVLRHQLCLNQHTASFCRGGKLTSLVRTPSRLSGLKSTWSKE
jgi:hypothetical protein